jgi:hypothetical protein
MWYTHGKTNQDLDGILAGVSALVNQEIFDAIANLDLETLLNSLAGLNTATIWSLVGNSTTVIGYATSSDGVNWTVVDDEVFSLGNTVWDGVGTPCVIKDGGSYQMWYTHDKTSLTIGELGDLLTGLTGTSLEMREAIIGLMDSTSSVIGYATSTNGTSWTPGLDDIVTVSNSGVWSSVAAPSVIKNNATDYEMWFANATTDLTEPDLDAILADLPGFDINNLLDLLDGTSSVIGYATSDDGGVSWVVQNPSVLSGGSSGAWDGVGTPCVIKDGGSYQMWYGRVETDLMSTDIQTLFDELAVLKPHLEDLWDAYAINYDAFITDFISFIDSDINNMEILLGNSGTVIAYATSTDGLNWTEPETSLGPVGLGPWGSVGFPCVVYDSGTYEMWYSKGTDDLTAQYLVEILLGTNMPIGYATGFSILAETTLNLTEDTDDIIVLLPVIVRGLDSYTGLDAIVPGGISDIYGQATADIPDGIEFIEAREIAPYIGLVFNAITGEFSVPNITSPEQPDQSPVVAIVAILDGDCLTQYELFVTFYDIYAASAPELNVPEDAPSSYIFQRGDSTGEGNIGVGDALFILQYLIGQRTLNEINALNAASTAHDGINGDVIGVGDALFILQYLIGDRDTSFESIP